MKNFLNTEQDSISIIPNQFDNLGEAAVIDAPHAKLDNGMTVIPQQFLHYSRTRENVELIIRDIRFHEDFPLFVHEENDCIFLQVGIIGHENYPTNKNIRKRAKIVYGRRWYIEPHTPTSEVIQTAYLAIKKAREHELREYFYMMITHSNDQHRTTPFNTHMDLPLMAKNPELFTTQNNNRHTRQVNNNLIDNKSTFEQLFDHCIQNYIQNIKFGTLDCLVEEVKTISPSLRLVSIRIDGSKEHCERVSLYFPEQVKSIHHILLPITQNIDNSNLEAILSDSLDTLVYELFQSMLKKSNEYINQNFEYKDFKRFSQNISPESIAHFSASTRLFSDAEKSDKFIASFKAMVSLVDGKKAPMYARNISLYHTQRQAITKYQTLDGFHPFVETDKPNRPFLVTDSSLCFDSINVEIEKHLTSSEIIAMAWCDKTSFEDIKLQTGLNEDQVIKLMKKNLKPSSFRLWRKRVYGRLTKHKALKLSRTSYIKANQSNSSGSTDLQR